MVAQGGSTVQQVLQEVRMSMTVGLHNYNILYTYRAWAVIKRTDVDINIDIKKQTPAKGFVAKKIKNKKYTGEIAQPPPPLLTSKIK